MVGKYEEAKEQYRGLGIDTEQVLEDMQNLTISMHCWQGDDLGGFDHDGPLSGGIQATGNYIGKPRNVEELMKDLDLAFSLIPGKKKLNLHSSYAVFEAGQWVDRDKLRPEHFRKWVEYAKERSLGIDFNRHSFHMKKQNNSHCRVRMNRFENSGFGMDRLVSKLHSILRRNWENHVY